MTNTATCPTCRTETEFRHLHDTVHGIKGTHMDGSERFECVRCGFVVWTQDSHDFPNLRFVLDSPPACSLTGGAAMSDTPHIPKFTPVSELPPAVASPGERASDNPSTVAEVMWEMANSFNRDAKADPDGHYALCISAGAKMIERLSAQVSRLESELREANADRERLDWLDGELQRIDPVAYLVIKRDHDRDSHEWGNASAPVRREIDAARSGSSTGETT